MKAITDQLRARREALGITQTQLAEMTGYKQPHIARMENQGVASLATVARVCEALKCTFKLVEV